MVKRALIARRYGFSESAIRQVRDRRSFAHVIDREASC